MRKENGGQKSDLEICKSKILALLCEYNCSIETDDYHWCWLRDHDTDETITLC